MTETFIESIIEQAALAWLESFGWSVTHGLLGRLPLLNARSAATNMDLMVWLSMNLLAEPGDEW